MRNWQFRESDPSVPKTVAWRVVRAIALIGLVNFVLFVAGTFYLGGEALNGYRQSDHFFLGMHSNGPFTEVSRSIFLYSEWHALILIGNFALFFAATLLFRLKIFPVERDRRPDRAL